MIKSYSSNPAPVDVLNTTWLSSRPSSTYRDHSTAWLESQVPSAGGGSGDGGGGGGSGRRVEGVGGGGRNLSLFPGPQSVFVV